MENRLVVSRDFMWGLHNPKITVWGQNWESDAQPPEPPRPTISLLFQKLWLLSHKSHIWFSQLKRQLWHYSKGEHIPWAHVIKYRRNFTLISSVFQIMAGQMRSFDGIWFSDRPAQNAARWLPKPDDYTMTLKAEQIMGKLTWHQNRVSAKTERKKKKLGINSFPVFLKTFLISSHSSSGVCSPSCPQFLDSVGVLECDMFVLHPTLPHPWEPLLAGLFINSITSVNAFSPGYINNRIRPEFMQP